MVALFPPSQPLVASCSRRWMAAGARGARGVRAHGRVGAACSSPTATVTIPGPAQTALSPRRTPIFIASSPPIIARRQCDHAPSPRARAAGAERPLGERREAV